jgi:hypothetical protein
MLYFVEKYHIVFGLKCLNGPKLKFTTLEIIRKRFVRATFATTSTTTLATHN